MNASDAMSSVEPSERKIVISASTAPGNSVRVTVSDCGCGIASGNADSIFKPFVTTKSSGLGIGLSISRSIVEAHGGRIWGENNPQRGAAFHLELPSMSKARIA
jgi:two-component system sensor kinase FixL